MTDPPPPRAVLPPLVEFCSAGRCSHSSVSADGPALSVFISTVSCRARFLTAGLVRTDLLCLMVVVLGALVTTRIDTLFDTTLCFGYRKVAKVVCVLWRVRPSPGYCS